MLGSVGRQFGKRWGRQQPPPSVNVNWSNPITSGLVDLWLPSESFFPRNLVTAQLGTSTAVPPTGYSHGGRSWLFDGSTSSRFIDNTVQTRPTGEDYTLWCFCFPTATMVDTGYGEAMLDSDDGASNRRFEFPLFFTTAGAYLSIFNTGGSQFTAEDPNVEVPNTMYQIGGVVRHSDLTITVYKNGKVNTGSANPKSFTGSAKSDFSTIRLGKAFSSTQNGRFIGHIFIAARWRRALLSAEIQKLWADPYSLLSQPPSRAQVLVFFNRQRDATIPIENSQATVRRDATIPIENSQATVRRDATIPIENTAAVQRDATIPIENTKVVQRDATIPLRSPGFVIRDAHIPIENSQSTVRRDATIPIQNDGVPPFSIGHSWNVFQFTLSHLPHFWIAQQSTLTSGIAHGWIVREAIFGGSVNHNWRVVPNLPNTFSSDIQMPFAKVTKSP